MIEVTVIDWIILGFSGLLAIWGYAQGILVGALVLAGFGGGAVLGARIAPVLLSEGSGSPYAPLVALLMALTLGSLAAVIFEGLGNLLRRFIAHGPFAAIDSLGGALLAAALALGFAWVFGAVAAQTPQLSQFRQAVQKSVVLRELNQNLPPSGPILKALARFDPLPRINGPAARVPPPSSGISRSKAVRRASNSVVRVLGTACGLGVQGSGWVAAPEIVVTNAHVVAGEEDTVIQSASGGEKLAAEAVHFNRRDDLALLKVPGLSSKPLPLKNEAASGESVAVLGYPENGPFRIEPARLGTTSRVLSQDAYGAGPVDRLIVAFRGRVKHGNSGGAVVNQGGAAVATVFAASVKGDRGYGVPTPIVERALASASRTRVSTGPCTS